MEIKYESIQRTEASTNLYRLMDQIAENHELVVISGERVNAVLIAEENRTQIKNYP